MCSSDLLEIEGADDPDAPYTLWSISVADQDLSAVYLLDPDAGIRWYHLTDGLVLAAHATLDGAGVAIQVSRVAGEEAGDATTLDIVPWSGDALVLDHPLGHHDFVELPDGTFAAIVEVQGKFEGRAVIGDAIEILDRDGGRRELWNAFGSVRLEKNEGWTLDPADWTHANGIDYSPDRDLFALSLFRQQQVVLFDSDAAPHGLFGAEGDWTIQDDPGFGPQHGPRFTEDGLSLFDNAGAGASRWVSYALGAGTADPIAEVGEPWGDQSLVGGDGLERKDGSVVTTWGDLGYLLTTSSEGEVLRVVRTRPTGLAGRVGTLDDPF